MTAISARGRAALSSVAELEIGRWATPSLVIQDIPALTSVRVEIVIKRAFAGTRQLTISWPIRDERLTFPALSRH